MKKRTIRREKKAYNKSDRAITLIALVVTLIFALKHILFRDELIVLF